jgi:ankyrin repeat protein
VVRLLLEIGKANINWKDKDSWTPLSWAVERGSETVVRLLLNAGAKVHCEYSIYVSKSAPSLVDISIKSIANAYIFYRYRM